MTNIRRFVCIFFLMGLCLVGFAQIPKLISYQGILTDANGQALANDTYNVTIKIFDAETAGTELYSEDHSVNLINGLFNIVLGSQTSLDLPFDQAYYVSTSINGEELLPRSIMTASPYALNAPSNGTQSGANPSALDASDGSPQNVVQVNEEGSIHIALEEQAPIDFDVFTSIYGTPEKRIGLKVLAQSPLQSEAIGISGFASNSNALETGRTSRSRGIYAVMANENANILTGLSGRAEGGINNTGLRAIGLGGELNQGIIAEARGGEEDVAIQAFVDGGRLDRAISASYAGDEGWAGFFQGKNYFGIGSAPSDNNDAVVLVNDPFQRTSVGLFSNHTSGIAGNFVGGSAGIVARSGDPNGNAASLAGRVFISDDEETEVGGRINITTFRSQDALTVINNSSLGPGIPTAGIVAGALGPFGTGGYFEGNTGGEFVGNIFGLRATTRAEGGAAGRFLGNIESYPIDGELNAENTIIKPAEISVENKITNIKATLNPIHLNLDFPDEGRSADLIPGVLSLRGPSRFDVIGNPRITFGSPNVNSSIISSLSGFEFNSSERIAFGATKGVVITSQALGDASSSSHLNYGLQLNSPFQGISVRLLGDTNSDNAFLGFFDGTDETGINLRGRIVGQTEVGNVTAAFASEISSFIDNLLSPSSFQSFTGRSQSTSGSIDPFDSSQSSNWSGNTSNASGTISGTSNNNVGDIGSQFSSEFFTPEFVVEAVLLSIDAVKNAITFGSSLASIFDPEDIFSKGYDFVTSSVSLISFMAFAVSSTGGVAYESGSGDYAEWLIRADTNELIIRGDIVGVKAGEISKNFIEADHYMAISTAPAVIGKMPQLEDTKYYEKVAFMGQVPVKVSGIVEKGNYIIPSGKGDGLGIAIHPKQMRARDYHRIVGIAWEESDGKEAFKMINVAVGINQNDLANIVDHMQSVMNEMQVAIQEVNPNYQPKLFETIATNQDSQMPSYENYTVAPTHQSQLAGLFAGQQFNTQEEAIGAVKKAWKEVANIDINDHPHMKYILENPEQVDAIIANYGEKLAALEAFALSLSKK